MKYLVITASLVGLSACASITQGSSQSLSVNTIPVTGATCQLNNDDGSWYVPQTPGSVVIHRSASDMTVICNKDNMSGTAQVASSTKAIAFGNIIAGGIIGAAVDHSSGAAFDYPVLITVPMAKGGTHTNITPPKVENPQDKPEYPSKKRS